MASFLFLTFVWGTLLLNQRSNKLCAPSLHPTHKLQVPELLCQWQRLPSTQQATLERDRDMSMVIGGP